MYPLLEELPKVKRVDELRFAVPVEVIKLKHDFEVVTGVVIPIALGRIP
jgi:hypothetical protein